MRFLTENLSLKVVSVAIAVLLWIATVGDQDNTTAVSIPVQLRNIPRDLEISTGVPEKAYVEVRGSNRRLGSDEWGSALVVINLDRVDRAGERTFSILADNVNLPAGLEFVRSVPSQVRLKFEPRLTRAVPVIVRYGTLPAGYQISNQVVEPATVRIVGPESRVLSVDRVQTDPIELPPDEEELTFHMHGFAGDAQVRLEKPDQIFTVKVTLAKDR